MAFIKRIKTKRKTTVGYKSVVVVSNDAEENLVNTVDLAISPAEGQPIPSPQNMTLPLKVIRDNGNKRFVFNDLTFSDDAVNLSYNMQAVMKDINNKQVGESLKMEITVEDDGDPRLRSVVINQLNENAFKLKVVIAADNENEVSSVDVIFSDYSGPEPIPTEISLTNPKLKNGKKIFKDNTLTFDDPAAAADEIYYLVVDLKNAEGNSIGSTEYTVVVEGLDEV
jgi:hypothetical protein